MAIAIQLGVPRSMTTVWLRRTERWIVTAESLSIREKQLQAEVLRLRRRVRCFRTIVRPLEALLRDLGIELEENRALAYRRCAAAKDDSAAA